MENLKKKENLPAPKGINTLMQLDIYNVDKFYIRDGRSFAVVGEDQISLWHYFYLLFSLKIFY